MNNLVLIDGNAILHRAYHALPPLTTRSKEPINAVYGLVSMLIKIIQDLNPTHIAVCFDRKEPTFRHDAFEKYQAHRPPMEENLSGQFQKAKDVLTAMNIPVYELAGFEADDLIGTISTLAFVDEKSLSDSQKSKNKAISNKLKLKIDKVIIVTGDKDILQLVNNKVAVYLPIKGLSEAKLFGPDEVEEKMGVSPSQIVDFKALVGDPSDNYPGVAGIGPKTAIKLLAEFKNLDGVYENLSKIDASTRKKLEEGKEMAYLSWKLARIIPDIEIDVDLEKTGDWRIDDENVLNLFSEFGFKTLTNRVKVAGRKIISKNQTSMF